MLTLITTTSLFIFLFAYIIFYGYLFHKSKKSWNLNTNVAFQPKISILVPVHNEEETIEEKLLNIQEVDYPKEKIELIIVDDASEDNTLQEIDNALKRDLGLNIKTVKLETNHGKAVALNAALESVSSSIIIVSDADTLWPSDILKKALPYLADPTIGAVTSQGINKQDNESWVTKCEDSYLKLTSFVRLGQSKLHSTIRFEGGFCAFKREAFEKFDSESGSDDSGTALDVIQHNYRTILVPELIFYTKFPTELNGKFKIKIRRANQLIGLWVKSLKLLAKKQLRLPKRIVLPDFFLFIVNPIVFIVLCVSCVLTVLVHPLSSLSLFLIFSVFGLLIFARSLFVELVVDNLLLLYAFVSYLLGKRYVAWKKSN
ncbi:glycosyltransferase [Candidatus Bathyarchaeota archaeon]|nr:glycosyltransferase [Candidatus Bathyarchaeota archaeon]